MAKKPNPPPPDDFDPNRELADEVLPIDDDLLAPVEDEVAPVDDDLVVDEVVDEIVVDADELSADVGQGATQLVVDDDLILPDVVVTDEVAADEVVVDDLVADDLVADDLVADDLSAAEAPGEVLDDDLAANALLEGDVPIEATADALLSDEIVPSDDVVVSDDAAHDADTELGMPALDDDPFAGVGDDLTTMEEPAEELVGAAVGEPREDEPYIEEEIPKPATHWFTWTLIGLNVLAVLTVPYLLLMTHQKRQEYTYAVFRHDLAMLGLPTEEEERAITAAKGTLPGFRISADEIKRVVAERIGGQSDKFEAVNEPIVRRIPPSMLTPEILKDHFGKVDTPESVTTVEAEIRRIQKSLVPAIEKAAEDSLAAAPSDEAKRTRIARMLHPLAMDIHQSNALDKEIKSATGADLDKLYLEAVKRRMAFDFLLPLELFRPGDVKTLFVEKMGDLKALPLSEVLGRVNERLQSTIDPTYKPLIHFGADFPAKDRDTIEKRLTVAFTLLSLAHVKRPDGELLYPDLLERIPLVMGQYDFTLAAELFPSRILKANARVVDRIRIDREGFEVPNADGNLVRGKGFIDDYEHELQRIRFLQQDIAKAKLRYSDLEQQKARYETLLAERTKQRADVLARIAKSREKTAEDIAELRRFQDDLFRYQTELSDSEDRLADLHRQIEEKLGKGVRQP